MTWIKKGRIIWLQDSILYPENSNHMQVPTPWVMPDGNIRVFYASRNKGKAFVAYFDLSKDLSTVLKAPRDPIFSHGKPGMFDADGVMPSCVIENNGELWMYYIGWSELKNTARYQNEIGLAVSKDGGDTFERMFEGPIMGRSPTEPGLAVMPFVMYKNWFRMWYQSGTAWVKIGDKYEPVYVIKYAESVDGIYWERFCEQCIESSYPLEAFSRSSVLFKDDVYQMWVCARNSADYRGGGGSYIIDYAQSNDGKKFRRDCCNLELGEAGEWDSDMQAYPYVIELEDKQIMFYNGNGFGQTGIGIAVWE